MMQLKNIVVMPVAKRPEFLALSLERLRQTNQLPNDICICADFGSNLADIQYVVETYLPQARIFQQPDHIQAPSGCWNILDSIKKGYETGADRIFLVEEDVMVRPHFFDWHLSQTDCLASCGRKDRFHYPLYGPLYTNPGSCLHRELVEQIVPHINDDFFIRLREYLDDHFGPWDTQSNLDDGLVRRVIRLMGGKAVYPDVPVCAHQGFRAYNKLDLYMNYETDIEKKIARLREILRTVRPTDRYTRDFDIY